MAEPKRIRRSMYFVPADDPAAMEAAAETEADSIILDLEDMVAKANKISARDDVHEILESIDFGRKEVCARLNSLRTEYWHEDLLSMVDAGVDTVRLAKVEEPWEVKTTVEILDQLSDDPPKVMITIESPRGMQNGREITSVGRDSSLVSGVGIGLQDYTQSMGVPEPTTEIRSFVLQQITEFASMNDIDALGADYIHVHDDEGLRKSAEQAKAFGHVGQPVLHPDQIAVVNDVFTPTKREYEEAKRKVERYDRSPDSAVLVDGEFLEAPMADRYRRTIERYEFIDS